MFSTNDDDNDSGFDEVFTNYIFGDFGEEAVLDDNVVPIITNVFTNTTPMRRRRRGNVLSPSVSPWQPSDVPQEISFAEDHFYDLRRCQDQYHMSERELVCYELDIYMNLLEHRILEFGEHQPPRKLGDHFLLAFRNMTLLYFCRIYENDKEIHEKIHNTTWSNINGILDKVMNIYHHIVTLANERHGMVKFGVGEADFKERYFAVELVRQFENVYDYMESLSLLNGDSKPTMMEWKKKIFELYIRPYI